jgi:hypothetical protein
MLDAWVLAPTAAGSVEVDAAACPLVWGVDIMRAVECERNKTYEEGHARVGNDRCLADR